MQFMNFQPLALGGELLLFLCLFTCCVINTCCIWGVLTRHDMAWAKLPKLVVSSNTSQPCRSANMIIVWNEGHGLGFCQHCILRSLCLWLLKNTVFVMVRTKLCPADVALVIPTIIGVCVCVYVCVCARARAEDGKLALPLMCKLCSGLH